MRRLNGGGGRISEAILLVSRRVAGAGQWDVILEAVRGSSSGSSTVAERDGGVMARELARELARETAAGGGIAQVASVRAVAGGPPER